MKTLQLKSTVFILIAFLTTVKVFSQENAYTEKQKRHALKVNLIGNFLGTTQLAYEHLHRPGRSFELKATFVERGMQGFFGSVGYKFYKKPTFTGSNSKRRHLLEGTYLKPEVFFGQAKEEDWLWKDQKAVKKNTFGLVLNLGKQWVLGDAIIIDTYIGAGVGKGQQIRGYAVRDGKVLSGGLNLGFVF